MSDTKQLPATLGAAPAPMSMDAMQLLAESVAKSGLFGIRTPDQALVLMSIAQAEGRHPALAARDYHIINGSPAKKAEAMARDFLSAGGRIEWHQLDDTTADATFSHPSGGSARITWDQKRVAQAGLGSNGMHKKYPRQMLRSRVVSEGVRTVWPMATSGMYVPEEVAEFAPAAPRGPIDVTPKADLDRFTALPAADDDGLADAVRLAAEEAASNGTEAFRDYWRQCSSGERDMLRPDIARYQQVAQDADAKRAADRDDDEDPFGLPPLDEARAAQHSPDPATGLADRGEHPAGPAAEREGGAAIGGAAPAGDTHAPATDLLGDQPAENVFVPLPRDAHADALEYYGRQMLAMIAEQPSNGQRKARIRLANEGGIAKLKAALPDLYSEVMRALK